ncbi:hypothetical protein TNCV_530561 [Trichonephila clavipes]|nr:hypothetical protein TNCV_530561 [Trichonephila clavipes]
MRPERNVFLLHHDNARPHCNAQTQEVMGKLKFTLVPHTSYSPDLTPLDFFVSKIEGDVEKSTFFNGCRSSGSRARLDIQPTRIFLHGRNEEMDRTIKQICNY